MSTNKGKYNNYWIKILGVFLIILVISGYIVRFEVKANELIKGYVTIYTSKPNAITSTGNKVREGICASSKEYEGKTIIIYQRMPDGSIGDVLGIYECLDTGGTKGIKEGIVIDVWKPDNESKDEFINRSYENDCEGKIWIQVLDSNG
jgi:hypothetical protein